MDIAAISHTSVFTTRSPRMYASPSLKPSTIPTVDAGRRARGSRIIISPTITATYDTALA
jgi:hypothetical protein